MIERFTDTAWTSGDLQKATTSPSQTALSNWMWYFKYQLVDLNPILIKEIKKIIGNIFLSINYYGFRLHKLEKNTII